MVNLKSDAPGLFHAPFWRIPFGCFVLELDPSPSIFFLSPPLHLTRAEGGVKVSIVIAPFFFLSMAEEIKKLWQNF